MTCAGFLLVGCSKKESAEVEPTPAADTNVTKTADVEAPTGPPPAPKAFSDPVKQTRFAQIYTNLLPVFNAVAPGSPVRVNKKTGGRVEGDLVRITGVSVFLSTPDGIVVVPREEMAESSERELFADAFSSHLAERQVLVESVEGSPQELISVFFSPESAAIIETRRLTAERVEPRAGPGLYFAPIPGAELFRGQSVGLVHETNGWICVKAGPAAPILGWMPKFATFMLNPEDRKQVNTEVATLIDSGLVIMVEPKRNEALVDGFEWRRADPASMEGKSRLLAIYCGQQKGSKLYWVDIKDALSGKRLAEYSVSKGFKLH